MVVFQSINLNHFFPSHEKLNSYAANIIDNIQSKLYITIYNITIQQKKT
jgi:hypothetical protein